MLATICGTILQFREVAPCIEALQMSGGKAVGSVLLENERRFSTADAASLTPAAHLAPLGIDSLGTLQVQRFSFRFWMHHRPSVWPEAFTFTARKG